MNLESPRLNIEGNDVAYKPHVNDAELPPRQQLTCAPRRRSNVSPEESVSDSVMRVKWPACGISGAWPLSLQGPETAVAAEERPVVAAYGSAT
jgi:hypothetical protein